MYRINQCSKKYCPFHIFGEWRHYKMAHKQYWKRKSHLQFTSKREKIGCLISCVVFWTSINNISVALSTRIHGHQWEGICLNPKQLILYEDDPEYRLAHCFLYTRLLMSSLLNRGWFMGTKAINLAWRHPRLMKPFRMHPFYTIQMIIGVNL